MLVSKTATVLQNGKIGIVAFTELSRVPIVRRFNIEFYTEFHTVTTSYANFLAYSLSTTINISRILEMQYANLYLNLIIFLKSPNIDFTFGL